MSLITSEQIEEAKLALSKLTIQSKFIFLDPTLGENQMKTAIWI